jgi:hypothetical protein
VYFYFISSIFDDSYDAYLNVACYFLLFPFFSYTTGAYLVDLVSSSNLVNTVFTDEWFKYFLASKDISLVYVFHPEAPLIKSSVLSLIELWGFGSSPLREALFDVYCQESFRTPLMLLPQLATVIYTTFLLILLYFSYYSSPTTEESTIDADYLAASATVEAEEEIGSIDDLVLNFIVVLYLAGWYFYAHCWALLNIMPELLTFVYCLPIICYIVLCMPCYLAYDFGIFFLAYLRGVGPSVVFYIELMYDYIAFGAFYVRLFVQGVRLALMVVTYVTMHDLVLSWNYNPAILLGSESA